MVTISSLLSAALFLFGALVSVTGAFASGTAEPSSTEAFNIGVFVPGVVDGSPTYELMVQGVERAATEAANADVVVVEGGFNQATWQEGVTTMAAGGTYDLIVTSNPSMPEICAAVAESFPEQRFLVLDGYMTGVEQMHTILFNQREQAFLAGYFAGNVTRSTMENANNAQVVGLLAGQEYPIMNEVILPSFTLGARSVNPETTVDFRVLGNWYDAGKAADLASDMFSGGADIILTIAGGGNQGTISAARDRGAYAIWYDDSGYDQAPGVVVGSAFVRQDQAAYEGTSRAIAGTLPYGEAQVLGVKDGMVSFDTEHREFQRNVPAPIQESMKSMLERLRTGDLQLEMQLP